MCYCTALALFQFLLHLRAISRYKPSGAYVMEGFLRYEFGGRGIYWEGPIHEGAYFRNFTALQLCVRHNTVCIFYGTCLQSTR